MKGVPHISLIFCVLVTITKGWILPLSVGHQTFSPKKMVSVSRVTRQINDAEYSSVLDKGVCSPSFALKYINVVSQCGSQGNAAAIANEKNCRQSSIGEYCSSVNIHLITSGSQLPMLLWGFRNVCVVFRSLTGLLPPELSFSWLYTLLKLDLKSLI